MWLVSFVVDVPGREDVPMVRWLIASGVKCLQRLTVVPLGPPPTVIVAVLPA